jgi:hypothetical protein
LYAFHQRKFPKVTSETQVSFVNEAPAYWSTCRALFDQAQKLEIAFPNYNLNLVIKHKILSVVKKYLITSKFKWAFL